MVRTLIALVTMFALTVGIFAQPVVNGGNGGGDDLSLGHSRYAKLEPQQQQAFFKLDGDTRNLMEKVKFAIENCKVKSKFDMSTPSKFYLYLFSRNLELLPKGNASTAGKKVSTQGKTKDQKTCRNDNQAQVFEDCVVQDTTVKVLAKMVADPYFHSYLKFNYDQNDIEAGNTIQFFKLLIKEYFEEHPESKK